ncbi:MAG: ExeA family protein, partial [Casimicrobium sp.]
MMLVARRLLTERAMSQSDLRRELAALDVSVNASALSRWLNYGKAPAGVSLAALEAGTNSILGADAALPDRTTVEVKKDMLTSKAKQHFRLPADPFVNDIRSADDVYLAADQRHVLDTMYYAAKHSGFVAVIGESGAGKSVLRRALIDRVEREEAKVVLIMPKTIDKGRLTAEHICHAIIDTIGAEPPRRSREALANQVQRLLTNSSRMGIRHLLVIEEAHDLSVATLKLLKRFYELEHGYQKLLGIVLVGQPELATQLDERRNYEAREVIRRCEVVHLRPLSDDDAVAKYVAHKLARIGAD